MADSDLPWNFSEKHVEMSVLGGVVFFSFCVMGIIWVGFLYRPFEMLFSPLGGFAVLAIYFMSWILSSVATAALLVKRYYDAVLEFQGEDDGKPEFAK